MKKIALILALVLAFGVTDTASAKDKEKETVVFTVSPKMTCRNCENKIKTNIRFEKGVNDITTNLKEQTVTVTYDPAKTDKSKLAAAFKKIGYTAKEAVGKQ